MQHGANSATMPPKKAVIKEILVNNVVVSIWLLSLRDRSAGEAISQKNEIATPFGLAMTTGGPTIRLPSHSLPLLHASDRWSKSVFAE